jgi:hypothetical protein
MALRTFAIDSNDVVVRPGPKWERWPLSEGCILDASSRTSSERVLPKISRHSTTAPLMRAGYVYLGSIWGGEQTQYANQEAAGSQTHPESPEISKLQTSEGQTQHNPPEI